MKRIVIPLLVAVLLTLSACGSSTPPATDSAIPPPAAPSSAKPSASTPTAPAESTPVEPVSSETPFEKFQSLLDGAGYSYETVTMGAELVGASAGEKYKFDFGTVELYQFDENSDALAKALDDGGITLEGFGVFPCEFNGNLAVLIDVTENTDSLLSLFNSL